jgi:hypothetical protein
LSASSVATTNIKIMIQADHQQWMSLIVWGYFSFSYKGSRHSTGYLIEASEALINLIDRKGIITKQELLEEMKRVQASMVKAEKWTVWRIQLLESFWQLPPFACPSFMATAWLVLWLWWP